MDDQYNLTQGRLYPSVTTVVLVLFLTFIVTGCLRIYIRNCTNAHRRGGQHVLPLYTIGSHKLSHGLQSLEIETLPTYIYSDVKDLNVGKGSLECAVCLGEFQNHESLRVLPKCDHVFHPSCIDPWLTLKSTCPVCRTDLLALDKLTIADFTADYTSESTQSQSDGRSASLSIDDVAQPRNCECEKHIPTAEFEFPAGEGRDMELACDEDTKKLEMAGTGSGGLWYCKFKRSNSTGSSTVIGLHEELIYQERFRLKLSEEESQRRRIMIRSEHIRRETTSTALSLLPSDRSGYRSGADEGDGSGRQVSSLSRKCSEPIMPATIEGRSCLSGRGDEP